MSLRNTESYAGDECATATKPYYAHDIQTYMSRQAAPTCRFICSWQNRAESHFKTYIETIGSRLEMCLIHDWCALPFNVEFMAGEVSPSYITFSSQRLTLYFTSSYTVHIVHWPLIASCRHVALISADMRQNDHPEVTQDIQGGMLRCSLGPQWFVAAL